MDRFGSAGGVCSSEGAGGAALKLCTDSKKVKKK